MTPAERDVIAARVGWLSRLTGCTCEPVPRVEMQLKAGKLSIRVVHEPSCPKLEGSAEWN